VSEYLKHIPQIDRCVSLHSSKTSALQDWLLELDERANPNSSSDGLLSEAEFNFLKSPEGQENLDGFHGKELFDAVSTYQEFSQKIDAYVDQEFLKPNCACPEGKFSQTEAGWKCSTPLRVPGPLRSPKKIIPRKKFQTPPPPAEPLVQAPENSQIPQDEYGPPEGIPFVPTPEKPLPPHLSLSAQYLLGLPTPKFFKEGVPIPKAIGPAPCAELRGKKKYNTAEKIIGGAISLVPQAASLLEFVQSPDCWGKKMKEGMKR